MIELSNQEKPSPPCILVIDDTEVNRDYMAAILTSAGFDVDLACDGESGLEAAWCKSYDLVLMDIEMPVMNGFEAASRLRSLEGAMAGVPIAALTSTTHSGAKELSLLSGIDEFISRPASPQTLVSRVTEIIAARSPGANDWKPVWRTKEFTDFTKKLDGQEADAYLEGLMGMLIDVETAIDAGATTAETFTRDLNELFNLSSLLGFAEINVICGYYKSNDNLRENRSRDPNLLGAINRARCAIASHKEKRLPYEGPIVRSGQC